MKRNLVGILLALMAAFAVLILSGSPATFARKPELPQETHDGLVLLQDTKVDAAYVDPDADFSVYDKIMILDCHVAFKKNWQRDQNRSRTTDRVTSRDMEKMKTEVGRLFREVFTEELEKEGGYEIVAEAPGDDVLLVRPAIIDLDVTAPDTLTAGRSRTFTSTAGAATIYIELYDSVSGDILARASDRKTARTVGGHVSYSNRVTNVAEAKKMLRAWAKLLRTRLETIQGKAG